jgi:hypothetical protein
MAPAANVLNWMTVNGDSSVAAQGVRMTPQFNFDIDDRLATITQLGTEILAAFHLETARILDIAKSHILISPRIECRIVFVGRTFPSHLLCYVYRALRALAAHIPKARQAEECDWYASCH